MPLKFDLQIDISGPVEEDRAALVAFISKLLQDAEENLIIQHADPKIDEKMLVSESELMVQLRSKTIFVREIMHD
jgi:hypothetical protein